MRKLFAILALVTLAGCGPTPHPFVHDEEATTLPQPMRALSIASVPEAPGLAEALVAAFETEDIAAAVDAKGDNFLRLTGKIEKGSIHWSLIGIKDNVIGKVDQGLAGAAESAPATAQAVAKLLRAEDMGVSDLANRPKVMIDKVSVTGALDADLLKRALAASLEQRGLQVVAAGPQYHVSGLLRITPGLAGHDLVEISWIVNDDKGVEIGRVNQGGPTERDEIISHGQQMTHQIADGGAEGIEQLTKVQR